MTRDFVKIEIDGAEVDSIYGDMIQLEVELDDELASMFRLSLCMIMRGDGWSNVDNELFRPWREVRITAGLEDDNELLLAGYITHLLPKFGANSQSASLEVWGMDKSVAMDRSEILKDWPDKSDSNIAEEIFAKYGLAADVQATALTHDAEVATIIQRETDMQFLKRLALRNGYVCYVDGDSGVFKPEPLDEEAQPVLAVHFGSQTTLHDFSIELNALAPANVGMSQIDRINKQVIEVNIEQSTQPALAASGPTDLVSERTIPSDGRRVGVGQMYLGSNSTFGQGEMESLCQGLYNKAEWLVRAQGEVNTIRYNHVLRPRKKVTVKGVGESYSGEYYVNHVTHIFNSEGYSQKVKMKRNGILLTGDENFSDSPGLGLPF